MLKRLVAYVIAGLTIAATLAMTYGPQIVEAGNRGR